MEWEIAQNEIEKDAFRFLESAGVSNDVVHNLRELGYFRAPASKDHHLCEAGGLVRHSINVTQRLVDLTNAHFVIWPRPESPYLVGMLHDIVKCLCYRPDKLNPGKFVYVQPSIPVHGEASLYLATIELGVKLLPVEAAAIRWHMGAFRLDDRGLREYSAALDEYPEQLIYTHAADHAASRIDEAKEVIV